MQGVCDIKVGGYKSGSPVQFDDVALSGGDPATFTTGLAETFPASLLNNTQPAGYPSGTGGATAINRVISLTFAGVPAPDAPNRSIYDYGINGDHIDVPITTVLRTLAAEFRLPYIDMSHADYNRTWDDLKQMAERHAYLWVLHKFFCFKGSIREAPGLYLGYQPEGIVEIAFDVKKFYRATVSGSTKLYTAVSH